MNCEIGHHEYGECYTPMVDGRFEGFNQTELKAKQILADLAGNEEAKAYSESLNNIMTHIMSIQDARRKMEAKLDEL